MINRRKVLASGVATGIAASFGGASARAVPGMRSREFKPGDVWLDTSGKPIQVRGSSIIQVTARPHTEILTVPRASVRV